MNLRPKIQSVSSSLPAGSRRFGRGSCPGTSYGLSPNPRSAASRHPFRMPPRSMRRLNRLFSLCLQQTQAHLACLLLKHTRKPGKEPEGIRITTDDGSGVTRRQSTGRLGGSGAQHEDCCGAVRYAVDFGQHPRYRPCCGRQDGQQHYPAQSCSRKLEHLAYSLYDEQISGFTAYTYLRPINASGQTD